ncbi:MAG: outer membrane lipoprotein chaperone LolA [Sulfurimicrobium sp.]|nr:outer membrane lipoprotein chaperone LolA [Sulfurimicrobium sp.]MDP1706186.1 outer membrane lipoprotein chaperone LolA [Sulfurimicrobium sp.]MDP2199398.1 outer membrane lipoprotein chaperone LolA [Sulfurimicrobium sp.]MDP3689198.1 outer membrane lipoprotein chaperone LolA [Sulfurimicrobium sp.]
MKYLALLLFLPAVALASGVDSLKNFLQNSRTVKAQFTQTVLDRNGKQVQSASGAMQFSRPGKFRWEYNKPYPQLIVGDGAKVWMYDADLNQVTVRKLDQALGNTPAALLAGNNAIEQNFTLADDGKNNGLEWVEASPKGKEGSFERIRLAFRASTLEVMELRDHFGQTTIIRFAALELNPKLAPQLFTFAPPQGADVVGD